MIKSISGIFPVLLLLVVTEASADFVLCTTLNEGRNTKSYLIVENLMRSRLVNNIVEKIQQFSWGRNTLLAFLGITLATLNI